MPRLFVDELLSVGLVEAGDNPGAEVVIYKSRETPVVSMSKTSAESAPTKEEYMDLSAIEDAELRKTIEEAFAEKDAEIAELTVEPDPVEEATPEVRAVIKEQADKLEELEKSLTAERTARKVSEYTEKAKPLQGLLGKPDEVGPVLAELSEAAPDAYGKLESALNAAAQREDMAKLFSELGAGEGEGESDPIGKRDAWVSKNKKDDETESQTRARFWAENPDQVEESRSV